MSLSNTSILDGKSMVYKVTDRLRQPCAGLKLHQTIIVDRSGSWEEFFGAEHNAISFIVIPRTPCTVLTLHAAAMRCQSLLYKGAHRRGQRVSVNHATQETTARSLARGTVCMQSGYVQYVCNISAGLQRPHRCSHRSYKRPCSRYLKQVSGAFLVGTSEVDAIR